MMRSRHTVLITLFALAACAEPPAPEKTPGLESSKEQNLHSIAASTRAAGNLEGAAELYRQMAVASTGDITPHLELASIYRQQKQPEAAVEVLYAAQKLQPHDVRVEKALGSALIAANKPGEGLVVYDGVLNADARDTGALNGRGVALDALGDHAKAQDAYRRALLLEPENTGVLNNLALSLILTDRPDAAIPLLERLGTHEDASPTVRQNLALAYGLKGDKAKAMELGLKDLTPQEAEENLRFYDYYKSLKLSGEPAYQSVPVAPVVLQHAKDTAAAEPPPPAAVQEEAVEAVKEQLPQEIQATAAPDASPKEAPVPPATPEITQDAVAEAPSQATPEQATPEEAPVAKDIAPQGTAEEPEAVIAEEKQEEPAKAENAAPQPQEASPQVKEEEPLAEKNQEEQEEKSAEALPAGHAQEEEEKILQEEASPSAGEETPVQASEEEVPRPDEETFLIPVQNDRHAR